MTRFKVAIVSGGLFDGYKTTLAVGIGETKTTDLLRIFRQNLVNNLNALGLEKLETFAKEWDFCIHEDDFEMCMKSTHPLYVCDLSTCGVCVYD